MTLTSCGPVAEAVDAAASAPPATKHGLCLDGFHPALVPAIPSPEAFKASPHRPVVVTLNPFADEHQSVNGDKSVSVNLVDVNTRSMELESELGWGRLEIHIRGADSSQASKFDGKKRFVHAALQMRFKAPVVAGDLCIGQEMFSQSAVPLWLSEALLTVAAKTFSSTTRVSVRSEPRYFMNPLLAACQLVNVSKPGEEPGLWDAEEDVRLMLPGATDSNGRPLPSEARRKWCDVPSNIEGAAFDTRHVYTFHFWQHYADFAQYKLSIGMLNVDLAPILKRSPLQLTLKDVGTDKYALSVLVWSERSLYGAGGTAAAAGAAAAALPGARAGAGAASRLVSGFRGLLGGR